MVAHGAWLPQFYIFVYGMPLVFERIWQFVPDLRFDYEKETLHLELKDSEICTAKASPLSHCNQAVDLEVRNYALVNYVHGTFV